MLTGRASTDRQVIILDLRRRRIRTAILVITVLWIGGIFFHSLQPAAASHTESVRVLRSLGWLPMRVTLFLVRKSAHFAEFFVLGILLFVSFRMYRRNHLLLPLGTGLATAALDETIQRFVPGRSGEWKDVLLDFSGIVSACLLALLILTLYNRRKRRKHHGG